MARTVLLLLLTLVAFVILLLIFGVTSIAFAWLLFLFGGVGLFLLISFSTVWSAKPPRSQKQAGPAGQFPRTALEAYMRFSDQEFEFFSAALVIGTRDDFEFVRHVGGSGDQGVDALLRNPYGIRVCVQSKHFAFDTKVSSGDVRDFSGALLFYDSPYGYFVTTSSFTPEALRVVGKSVGRIRAIDGDDIDRYLKLYYNQIVTAWNTVRETHQQAQVK